MVWVPIAISVLALITSAFTFWWGNVRRKRALYVVRINKVDRIHDFFFALVNSGNSAVLIAGISVLFEGPTKGSGFYPGAKVTSSAGESNLVEPGKAIEFCAMLPESLSEHFAQSGKREPEWQDLFTHPLFLEVAWVEMTGAVHRARVSHSKVGFEASGMIRGVAPITDWNAKADLYEIAGAA